MNTENLSLYSLITSDNMVAYWIEKNVNKQPMLGAELFPNEKRIGVKLDWIKGAHNQPIQLRLSAFDSKSIRRDNEGIEQYTTKMPFFKESMYIDEEMRQQLLLYIQANNTALADEILAKIFEGQVKLIAAAAISAERMRMQALTTGSIVLGSNGQSYEYDFGVPADQKKTVAIDWDNEDADILSDIEAIKDQMSNKGVEIVRAVCNNSVARSLRKNKSIKNTIYVLAGGNISSITDSQVLNYIYDQSKIEFVVYDNVYVGEDGQAHKYIPDNTVVFLPEGTLGKTNYGTTPAEADLVGGLTEASVGLVDTGVAVVNRKEVDPVTVETIVSMICLPSFERADEIVILDTKK